ncbi:hypothetical protein GQ600_1022 [Phytophthora cactorum]|nr:hypothetical protein GQ600_1022 [Phytophthora cactorum]
MLDALVRFMTEDYQTTELKRQIQLELSKLLKTPLLIFVIPSTGQQTRPASSRRVFVTQWRSLMQRCAILRAVNPAHETARLFARNCAMNLRRAIIRHVVLGTNMRVQLSCLHRVAATRSVGNAKAFARIEALEQGLKNLNDQMIILVDMKLQLWIMLSGIGIDTNSDEGGGFPDFAAHYAARSNKR